MREYQFITEIDVHNDLMKFMQIVKNRRTKSINENKYDNQLRVTNFINAVSGYNIAQSDLTVDKLYCPIEFSFECDSNIAIAYTVIAPAIFNECIGGRLWFTY